MPAQIAILLALSDGLFDSVPLDRMTEAEQAVQAAATDIPVEVVERLQTAKKLSDEDRKAFIDIARRVLTPFQPTPEAKDEKKA